MCKTKNGPPPKLGVLGVHRIEGYKSTKYPDYLLEGLYFFRLIVYLKHHNYSIRIHLLCFIIYDYLLGCIPMNLIYPKDQWIHSLGTRIS
jgi:hypothetical protein